MTESERPAGRVVRVIGPVVDVEFPPEALPEINTALKVKVTLDGNTSVITCEVAQHVGDSTVRAIALRPTDGLVRGAEVENTGAPIDTTPDQIRPSDWWPIHRDPPPFQELEPKSQMLETGIKVIDLLEPYV